MASQQYECNHCQTRFPEPRDNEKRAEAETRCPMCDSTNVKKSALSDFRDWLSGLRRPT